MRPKHLVLTCLLCLLVPVVANAATFSYSVAEIDTANSTVDLVPSTSSAGTLNAVKCIFASTASGASVKVTATLDGNASAFTVDPTDLEEDSTSRFLSGWIPINLPYSTSIHVTLNNTLLGTTTIFCWAAWTH